jgi:transposase
VYEVLVERGFEVFLVNARHTKNLPGRKSDVQECQWLMKLNTYGLLNNSFRPTEGICVLRTYWRQRDEHVKAASAVIQRMQKVLTEMNVQIANVISDISGVTGMAILDAILKGERDRYQLADLANPRIQASKEEIARSLEGNWRPELLFVLRQQRTSTTSIKSALANAMKLSSCICAPWRTKRNRKISRRIPNGASGRVATPRGSTYVVSCTASLAWI